MAAVQDIALTTADQEWRELTEPLLAVGGRVAGMWPEVHDDPQLRADLFWMLYSEIGAGFMALAYANDHHPDWYPCWSQVFNNFGNINPDGVYYMSPIDDRGVYKLAGTRGSLRIVDLQLGDGSLFAWGKANEDDTCGPTLANYDLDDAVTLDEHGWFEVILSRERPKGYQGDWWKLPENSNYLLVRQFSYDWLSESDARIAIDRLDTPAAKPRRGPDEVKTMLEGVPDFIYASQRVLDAAAHGDPGLGSPAFVNRLIKLDYAVDQGGRSANWYIAGRFDLQPDEAMILEVAPGDCRYWNLQLGNELMHTLDLYNRIISTNGHFAHADEDGAFRIVVSEQDPGVFNWLDTVGHQRGFMWGRMDRANDYEPKATKVKLSELRDHLPASTRESTPEQRDAQIRRRRMSAQLRRRW